MGDNVGTADSNDNGLLEQKWIASASHGKYILTGAFRLLGVGAWTDEDEPARSFVSRPWRTTVPVPGWPTLASSPVSVLTTTMWVVVPENALAVFVVRGRRTRRGCHSGRCCRFRRRFPAWGRFGVSAFVAADEDEIDALCETKLTAWPMVVVFARAELETAGVAVVPTFRAPHVTLADQSLDALTEKLLLCDPSHCCEPLP